METRRLLAAALERVPAIEPPQNTPSEAPRSPSEPSPEQSRVDVPPEQERPFTEEEPERRSWWRRLFEG